MGLKKIPLSQTGVSFFCPISSFVPTTRLRKNQTEAPLIVRYLRGRTEDKHGGTQNPIVKLPDLAKKYVCGRGKTRKRQREVKSIE